MSTMLLKTYFKNKPHREMNIVNFLPYAVSIVVVIALIPWCFLRLDNFSSQRRNTITWNLAYFSILNGAIVFLMLPLMNSALSIVEKNCYAGLLSSSFSILAFCIFCCRFPHFDPKTGKVVLEPTFGFIKKRIVINTDRVEYMLMYGKEKYRLIVEPPRESIKAFFKKHRPQETEAISFDARFDAVVRHAWNLHTLRKSGGNRNCGAEEIEQDILYKFFEEYKVDLKSVYIFLIFVGNVEQKVIEGESLPAA